MNRNKQASDNTDKKTEKAQNKDSSVDDQPTKKNPQNPSKSIPEQGESDENPEEPMVCEGEILPPETEQEIDDSKLDWEDDTEDSEEFEASLENQLKEAQALAEENRNAYLRALAEMQNIRKRSERDTQQSRQYAVESFARDLLPVADNLERALDAIPEECGLELKTLQDGVLMIQKELIRSFDKHGVKRIDALNTPFDPHLHQAVMQIATDKIEPGKVVQEMQTGYQLNGRLLRPSMVGVAKSEG